MMPPKNLEKPKLSTWSFIFVSLFHLVSYLTNYLKCLPEVVVAVLYASALHIAWLTENAVFRFGTVLEKEGLSSREL